MGCDGAIRARVSAREVPDGRGRRVPFASAAALMPLSAGWRGWRGAARRDAERCTLDAPVKLPAACRRGASRRAAVSRCTPRWPWQWMPRRQMRAGDWGAVRAVPAIKNGIAVTWVCLGHKGHVCTVGDRVWGVAGRVARVAASRRRTPTVCDGSRGQNSGPPLT